MCSVDWGLVVNLFVALGSCGAAIAAVWIATRDRCERKAERSNAAKAQAMLVLVDVEMSQSSASFEIWIRNFGADPILDVEVDSATFKRIPTAAFKVTNRLGPALKVIDADRTRHCLIVDFVDEDEVSMIRGELDRKNNWHSDNAEPADLDVTIRFMDAQGTHWLRSLDSVKLAKRDNAL